MSEPKLEPCPFCGGEAKVMDMGYPHWVYCKNCGAKVHGGTHDEKDSIQAWNRRANQTTVSINQYGGECTHIGSVKNLTIR